MQKRKLVRLQAMTNRIQLEKRIEVEDLAKAFSVSLVTIRRDLETLEKQGTIIRDYGGAMFNKTFVEEDSLYQKYKTNIEEKVKIAEYAASLVKDGENIILDAGSTTSKMIHFLSVKKNLTVLTNGLNIAYELARSSDINLILLGGILRHKSLNFSDSYAQMGLHNYNFTKMFFASDGIDFTAGITTTTENQAKLNQLMMEKAKEVILIADSTKFNKRSFCSIAPINRVDMIVTDSNLDSSYIDEINKLKIKLVAVKIP